MALLTKEDIAQAELNGIGRKTLYNRVYNMCMEVEEAISMPVMRKPSLWKVYENNTVVGRTTFYDRVREGWDPEEAAKTPLQGRDNQKILPEHIKIAEKNGIGYGTLRMRVYGYHWSIEKAIKEPIKTNHRREPKWLV